MIIEIALGIVLAVLILSLLPYILELSVAVGALALGLFVIAYAVFFIHEKPEVLFFIPFAALAFIINYFYKKSLKFQIFFWAAASFFGLLYASFVLYIFRDADVQYIILSALFFSFPAIFSIAKLRKTLRKVKKQAIESSSL
jgi:hypothetical protein